VISNTQILGVPFAEVAKVALKAHIDFPAGSIIAFGGDTSKIPAGWLFCDGKGYSKTLYPGLFAAIGTHWGYDGELFRVPDLRGVFLRGVNHGADDAFADPDNSLRTNRGTNGNTGNKVGSFQADELKTHSHEFTFGKLKRADGSWETITEGSSSTYNSKFAGGNETRPVNAYVNYIIKY
jgi:microcystin-dependent protein